MNTSLDRKSQQQVEKDWKAALAALEKIAGPSPTGGQAGALHVALGGVASLLGLPRPGLSGASKGNGGAAKQAQPAGVTEAEQS